MEDLSFESQGPTSLDTPKNRLFEYVCYATAHFKTRATKEIIISLDKERAKTGKCAKYIGKITDVAVTSGAFVGGLGPMAKG